MNDFILGFLLFMLIVWCLYSIPYLIRKGWGDAENRTKKVCDVCFRDISKWDKFVKEAKCTNL